MDQVKYWCGTMKANEEIIENKPTTQNVLKREYVMLEEEEEDEDMPAMKKKYFHQDSEDEDWDDPTLHKSNASISENEDSSPVAGKIVLRSKFKFLNIHRILQIMSSDKYICFIKIYFPICMNII